MERLPPTGPSPLTALALFLALGVTTLSAQSDRQVLAVYDRDRDGILNAEERNSAFDSLRFQSQVRNNASWGPAAPGARIAPADVKSVPDTVSLFDAETLRTIFIDFEDRDWEAKMVAFYRTDIDVPARVTVDGKVYPDVGIHFRGNSSFSSVPMGYKRSMDLSFDAVHAKQDLLGHNKINLLNANEDPTFLRGILLLEVARAYYMAPRANLVRVVINGENWGVYVNVEQFNGDMTKRWYPSGSEDARWKVPGNAGRNGGGGALSYLGDYTTSYRNIYQIKSDEDPAQWEALVAMIRTLNRTPPDKLEAALKDVLDVDGALRFLAVDNIFVSGDGFWSKGADYAIYRDTKGVFHLLPHDVNEYFAASGGRGNSGGGISMDPLNNEGDLSKALLGRLLAVPALKERYLKYVREISQKWLDWKTLGPIVQRYDTLARAEVLRDTKKLFYDDEYLAGVAQGASSSSKISLRNFVLQRRAYLDGYFGTP